MKTPPKIATVTKLQFIIDKIREITISSSSCLHSNRSEHFHIKYQRSLVAVVELWLGNIVTGLPQF